MLNIKTFTTLTMVFGAMVISVNGYIIEHEMLEQPENEDGFREFGKQQTLPLGETLLTGIYESDPDNADSDTTARPIVRLNGEGSEHHVIPLGQILRYYSNGSLVFLDSKTRVPSRYGYVEHLEAYLLYTPGVTSYSPQDIQKPKTITLLDSNSQQTVAGILYRDRDNRAIFTDSIRAIEDKRLTLPPLFHPPIEIRYRIDVTTSPFKLFLNIDDSGTVPDETSDQEDDRIELSGSLVTTTIETSSDHIEYKSGSLSIIDEHSYIRESFSEIEKFYKVVTNIPLETFGGGTRLMLEKYTPNSIWGGIAFGPGTLYTNGKNALFTTDSDLITNIPKEIENFKENYE